MADTAAARRLFRWWRLRSPGDGALAWALLAPGGTYRRRSLNRQRNKRRSHWRMRLRPGALMNRKGDEDVDGETVETVDRNFVMVTRAKSAWF